MSTSEDTCQLSIQRERGIDDIAPAINTAAKELKFEELQVKYVNPLPKKKSTKKYEAVKDKLAQINRDLNTKRSDQVIQEHCSRKKTQQGRPSKDR